MLMQFMQSLKFILRLELGYIHQLLLHNSDSSAMTLTDSTALVKSLVGESMCGQNGSKAV